MVTWNIPVGLAEGQIGTRLLVRGQRYPRQKRKLKEQDRADL